MVFLVTVHWRDSDGVVRHDWSGLSPGDSPGEAVNAKVQEIAREAGVSGAFLAQYGWWTVHEVSDTLAAHGVTLGAQDAPLTLRDMFMPQR